jgi:hypothetical protein
MSGGGISPGLADPSGWTVGLDGGKLAGFSTGVLSGVVLRAIVTINNYLFVGTKVLEKT